MSSLDLSNINSVPTPSSGKTTVYVDNVDKKLKTRDDAGVVTDYSTASGAITSLTGEVTGTGPGATATTVSNAAVIAKVLTGFTSNSGTVTAADSILSAIEKLASRLGCSWFGNGVDSVVTLNSNQTLVRDMYYDTLTIDPGVVLSTGGYRIFALNAIINNGTIDRSGSNAVLGTGGVVQAAGALGACVAGGTGGTAAAGTVGTAASTSLGGAGGAGGAGAISAGGAAGAVTAVTTVNGGLEVLGHARQTCVGRDLGNTIITSGSGGGGGGGNGAGNQGGGGGGGAGVIVIATRSLTGTGVIKANGGNGADAATGVNAGGGGAGGGGVIALLTENDVTATSLSLQVNAGASGTGNGTGANGSPGTVGRIYLVRT